MCHSFTYNFKKKYTELILYFSIYQSVIVKVLNKKYQPFVQFRKQVEKLQEHFLFSITSNSTLIQIFHTSINENISAKMIHSLKNSNVKSTNSHCLKS